MHPDREQKMARNGGEFGFSLAELRALMELRGAEGQRKVKELGGPLKVCTQDRITNLSFFKQLAKLANQR